MGRKKQYNEKAIKSIILNVATQVTGKYLRKNSQRKLILIECLIDSYIKQTHISERKLRELINQVVLK